MEWKTRQARDRHDARCASCQHRAGPGCGCGRCRAEADAQHRRREEERAAEREAALHDWLGRRDDADLVATISQLSVPLRIYLDRLRQHWAGHLDLLASLKPSVFSPVGGDQETYLLRYQPLGLVFVDDQQWYLHPTILDGRVPPIP